LRDGDRLAARLLFAQLFDGDSDETWGAGAKHEMNSMPAPVPVANSCVMRSILTQGRTGSILATRRAEAIPASRAAPATKTLAAPKVKGSQVK
jgi:hypothetical protein